MKIDRLISEFVNFMPEKLEDGILYISREFEVAIHRCACGCGDKIVTPIGEGGWKLTVGPAGEATLSPSIGNWQIPCRSHYWVRDGRVVDA